MTTYDKLCYRVWNLCQILFDHSDNPERVMKRYTKDNDGDFLHLQEKDMLSFLYPSSVPTLKRTEEENMMFFRSKVITINFNPSFEWITYFSRCHFTDETGIDPFDEIPALDTVVYELNKTIHTLGMKLNREDPSEDWITFAIFVYVKEKRLMVMFDMSAPCPYICVQNMEEDGKRQWKSLYYFFFRRS